MKVTQSGRQTARRLIILSAYVYASHFILGVLATPGNLILGVLVEFSGV